MSRSQVRLDARALFWRLALAVFVIRQCLVWVALRRMPFRHPGHRVLVLLFSPRGTRRSLFFATLAAGGAAVLGELLVRFVVRPMLDRWLAPDTDAGEWAFHLQPGESVVDASQARRASGRRWVPGSLVLTDRRLGFFPTPWDAEPWSVPRATIGDARLAPTPKAFWGLVLGWPDRLSVRAAGEEPELFAVPDPESVVSWFHPRLPALQRTPAELETW